MTAKRVISSQSLGCLGLPGTRDIVAAQCIRAGNYVYVGGQSGSDRTGRPVALDDPGAQARQACENITHLMEMAGGTMSDVVKLVVYMTDRQHRPAIHSVLDRFFPDVWPCHTEYIVPGLGCDGGLVALDAWAVVDDEWIKKQLLRTGDVHTLGALRVRRVAEGYRAGNLVYLSGQVGRPKTDDGGLGDPATQAHQVMGNLRALMEVAWGSLGDVVRVVRAVTQREDRAATYPAIQSYWSECPPPGTGLVVDGLADEELKIQVDAWGFIDTMHARKQVVRTHDVTPAGMLGGVGRATQCVRAGNLVFLQGQVGWTLESELVAVGDPVGQARQAMENIKTLMELAGGTVSDIVRVVIYVTDPRVCDLAFPVLHTFWQPIWPCVTSVVVKGLARPEMLIEIDAYGYVDDPM